MEEAKYFRRKNLISGPDGVKSFDSINKAKQASRQLQMSEDGALGRGSLCVVEKLPTTEATANG